MECQHDQRNRVPNTILRRQSCRPSKLAVAPRSVACGSLNRLLVTTRSNRSNEVADANGKIIGRCVEWTEARPGWEALLKTIGGLLMVATCMLIIPALIARNGRAPSILPLCTLGVAMLSLCVFEIAGRVPGQTHWVVFRNDGGIESSEDEAWSASLAEIANIECEPSKAAHYGLGWTHGVRVITRRGRVLHVANSLKPEDAMGLAVGLSEASESVRYVDRRQSDRTNPTEMVW